MRRFNVNVNGSVYDVVVEEIAASGAVVAAPVAAPAPIAAPAPAAAPTPVAAPVASAGSATITCPMPGTILSISASVGKQIKKGDVVMILEAMKMENEIMSPKDGIVASINVSSGATVNSGDVLAVIN